MLKNSLGAVNSRNPKPVTHFKAKKGNHDDDEIF